MSKNLIYTLGISVVVCCLGAVALGQVTTGTILGTVQDETGAVLPGAEVVVTHVDMGRSRTVISDDEGRYQVTNLNLGHYEIEASLPGFQTAVRTGIEITIDRRAVVDFTLNVGEITERVTVTGEAPLVETTSGSLGSIVDRNTVIELPLNGRDLTGLLTLQAGTVFVTTTRRGGNSGFSQRVSISGARPHDAAVLLDGTGVKGTDRGVPSGVSGNFLGAEGIQEFKIERNSYSAQYGGASGGVINVVSKSGSNDFHGSIYEFHRNDNLDATNFISNRDGGGKPPFIRNQFGFSVGGPIIENKTFFFWNYEGMRDRESSTRTRTLPNLDTRNGFLPLDLSDPANPTIQIGAPVVEVPGLQERVRPFFRLWPLPGPTATDQGDGTVRESINTPRSTDEDYYQLRVDHNFSDSDSLFGRYTFQDSSRQSFLVLDRWGNRDFVDNDFLTLAYTHIFSTQVLNTFRFGFGKRVSGQSAFEDPLEDFDLRFVPEDAWSAPQGADWIQGQLSIGGVSNPGIGSTQAGAGWTLLDTENWEYYDDVIYTRGPHSLKFGFTWSRVLTGGDNPSRPGGVYSFDDLVKFWKAEAGQFRGAILPDLDTIRELKIDTFGFYLQDDWQVTPRFNANLGLRYEFYTVPTEKDGKLSNLIDPLNDDTITMSGQILDADGEPTGVKSGESWFLNPSLKSFMPRIGLAFDPTGSGKTALRLGAGLFYNHIQPDTFQRAIFRSAPFIKETNFRRGINFPDAFDQVVNQGIGAVEMQPFDYNMKNPHMYQWNLNIQQEVIPGTAVTVGYAGSRGLNLLNQRNINAKVADIVDGRLVYAADAARPNQSELFGDLQLLSQDASSDSWYHALQMGLQRRFQAGYQLQLSYTYSRTIDESSQINSAFNNQGGGVSYWPIPDLRRSLAAFHVASAFSASGIWQLPFGQGQALGNSWNGLTETFLGGWQLSGILRMADGPATSITMSGNNSLTRRGGLQLTTPDLAAGGSTSPVLGTKDSFHYFDVSAFQPPPSVEGGSEIRTLGTVGRNTLIGPGVATLDFSLTKNTKVTETVNVQFRSEFFNILNRANFGLPNSTVFGRTGNPTSSAGRLGATTTSARQIQFGLRITF